MLERNKRLLRLLRLLLEVNWILSWNEAWFVVRNWTLQGRLWLIPVSAGGLVRKVLETSETDIFIRLSMHFVVAGYC